MQVSYDLTIAKVAFQIQATERPNFDNLFVHLGSFHIMLAYFKAIGMFIDECEKYNAYQEATLTGGHGKQHSFI